MEVSTHCVNPVHQPIISCPQEKVDMMCLSSPASVAIHVSSVDSMLNELSGTVELSVVTTFSIPAPKKFSALIRLKNGTAKCKISYLSVL